jgi:hypothetical protein
MSLSAEKNGQRKDDVCGHHSPGFTTAPLCQETRVLCFAHFHPGVGGHRRQLAPLVLQKQEGPLRSRATRNYRRYLLFDGLNA